MHNVVVHYGDWIQEVLSAFQTVIFAVAVWAFARFAPPALKVFVTNKMIENAVNYAIGAVEGASKDKVLELKVANSVIGVAEAFFLNRAPLFLKEELGPAKKLIIAELTKLGVLPADSSAVKMGDVK